MTHRPLGKTGINVAPLGFGCMRLPMKNEKVDDELATPLLQRAVDLGINFFDSHWFYCNYDSQRAVGEALRGIRDKVYISTKLAMWLVEKPEHFDEYLDKALDQLGLDYLDFYHFPYLSYKTWTDHILPFKLVDRAEKAKSKGLIRHLSFSFHSDPDKMPELIDTGAFSTVLGQYNLVDRTNEEFFAYAHDKGVGTMVMVPLLGGVLTDGGSAFMERMEADKLECKPASAAEMALRFVWSLPSVDMVLSGMSNIQQLEENVAIASAKTMSQSDREALIKRSDSINSLNDLFCTTCNYCHECPLDIKIGWIFQLYNQHNVWGLTDAVRSRVEASLDPTACTACGMCVKRCPQKIDIPNELKRVWPVLKNL